VDASSEALAALTERKNPPTPAELAALKASYDETILYLDSLVGTLLEDLRRLGVYQDSLIVLLSDHGEQFGEHKHLLHGHSLYQEEIHTPLIIKLPRGSGPPPARISRQALNLDVMPTVLDLLQIAPPPDLQGISLRPLLRGEAGPDRTVFSELNFLGQTAARKGPYKYIYSDFSVSARSVPQLLLQGLQPQPAGVLEEIYDLEKDPGETRNLMSGRPDLAEFFREQVGDLAERAAKYRRERFNSTSVNRIKLSQEDKEKLRALGYLR
jgi:arylsulfatase A-like enzyme